MDAAKLADVVARAKRRDPAAFDTLVDLYSARLYGYFYRLTGSRDDADDLLQDLFVRLVRMIRDYEHDDRLDAWIFRIATNLVRDRVRRSRTRRSIGLARGRGEADEDGDVLSSVPDEAAAPPGARMDTAEQVDRLQSALGQLPEPERQVILLRHFSQLTFREIADLMGTPLGTALARGHRGLARLRELMGDPPPTAS